MENYAIKRVQSQVYLSYAEREHNRRRQWKIEKAQRNREDGDHRGHWAGDRHPLRGEPVPEGHYCNAWRRCPLCALNLHWGLEPPPEIFFPSGDS